MNEEEARFLLHAHRPNGRDADDPVFADALAQARQDPKLQAWLEAGQKLDATLSAKLNAIQPPAGLRDTILAGSRASQPRDPHHGWWANPVWLAVAASVVFLLSLAVRSRFSKNVEPTAQALVALSLDDLGHHLGDHASHPVNLAAQQASLVHASTPLAGQPLNLDLSELKRKNCRTISLAGRDVFEVCFEREGHWYHLYASRVEGLAPNAADAKPRFTANGKLAASAWRNGKNMYVVASNEGPEILRRLF